MNIVPGRRLDGIATRLDTLLQDLNAQSQAAIIALYQAEDGTAFASTTTPR